MKKHITHWSITILLLCAILLVAADVPSKFFGMAGLNQISRSNQAYLEDSFNRSISTFVVLSIIKAGLAVLEGTEISLGIGIEVGNIVQAAYDYVDLAWRTVLISSVVLLGTQYILQTSGLVDQWFLTATLLVFFVLWLLNTWLPHKNGLKNLFRDISLVLTLFTVILYLVLPLSVAGGRLLSKAITAKPMLEAETGFSTFQKDVFPESGDAKAGFWSKVTGAKDKIANAVKIITTKTSELIIWVLKLIAGYLFDCVVFPLLLFVVLFWLSKFLIRYFFDIQKQRTLKEDLETVLHKFFPKTRSQNSVS
jgi:hypothetical protein